MSTHMSTLTIKFPDSRPSLVIEGSATPDLNRTATVSDELPEDSHPSIALYRVLLDYGDDSSEWAMLKLGLHELGIRDLREEVEAYNDFAEDLQGDVITRFYGFHDGKDGQGRHIAALLVEDIESSVGSLSSLPLNDRFAIAEHFGRMHLLGRLPQLDLSGKNVARTPDGSFRVILLHHLRKHICEWDGDWREGGPEPDIEEFKCEALLQCGDALDIWDCHHLPVVYVNGQSYLSFSACTTTTTEVVTVEVG